MEELGRCEWCARREMVSHSLSLGIVVCDRCAEDLAEPEADE